MQEGGGEGGTAELSEPGLFCPFSEQPPWAFFQTAAGEGGSRKQDVRFWDPDDIFPPTALRWLLLLRGISLCVPGIDCKEQTPHPTPAL